MRDLKKVVTAIPIYREKPCGNSISNCIEILKDCAFCLIAPNSLNAKEYEAIFKAKNKQYSIKRFDDKYFKSVQNYSELCLESKLYKAFQDYEYLFLFQEDGFIFKNELNEWCDKGFDYIGAPLFEGYEKADEKSSMIEFSGNGGVSLRKISSFIEVLEKEEKRSANPVRILHDFIFKNRFKSLKTEFQKLKSSVNEDIVITQYLRAKQGLNIAPNKDAMYFSFEVRPKRLYELTEGILPFACHGYKKYEPDFWKQFISDENF